MARRTSTGLPQLVHVLRNDHRSSRPSRGLQWLTDRSSMVRRSSAVLRWFSITTCLSLLKALPPEFYRQENFHILSFHRRPCTGYIYIGDLPYFFYGYKIFQRSSMACLLATCFPCKNLRFTVLLWKKDRLHVFYEWKIFHRRHSTALLCPEAL